LIACRNNGIDGLEGAELLEDCPCIDPTQGAAGKNQANAPEKGIGSRMFFMKEVLSR